MPSGTQSNLTALMAHCARRRRIPRGPEARTPIKLRRRRRRGPRQHPAAAVGERRRTVAIPLDKLRAAVKPARRRISPARGSSRSRTRSAGKVIPQAYVEEVAAFASEAETRRCISTARGSSMRSSPAGASLEAPVRAVRHRVDLPVEGTRYPRSARSCAARRTFVEASHRWRKMLGGGLQAGRRFLAAAGLYALDHHVERLADDHAQRCERLARRADDHRRDLKVYGPFTNMVFADLPTADVVGLGRHVARRRHPRERRRAYAIRHAYRRRPGADRSRRSTAIKAHFFTR